MSVIVHYQNKAQKNLLHNYYPYCKLKEKKIRSIKDDFTIQYNYNESGNGRFSFMSEEFISNEDVKKYYGDKLKELIIDEYEVKVIENGDKISIRYYSVSRKRKVGNQYFKVRRVLEFMTFNLKTKNFYYGKITKSNKKVLEKEFKVNVFHLPKLTEMKLKIRRVFNYASQKLTNKNEEFSYGEKISTELLRSFENLVFKKTNIHINTNTNYLEGEMYKLYLKQNNIVYPDTFNQYTLIKIPKKKLTSYGNLVNCFMSENQLKGKNMRVILNSLSDIDFNTLLDVYYNLEVDYFNKIRMDFFSKSLYGLYHSWFNIQNLRNVNTHRFDISNLDKKRIVNLINKDKEMSWSLIKDHLKMIEELKSYNEIVKMKFTNREEFNEEHYNISQILSDYKEGKTKRVYSEKFIDRIEQPIVMEDTYYPKILTTSFEYNNESSTQNNCVRTYIDHPHNLIISLRRGDIYSQKRATLEYRIHKFGINRTQSRGKFNEELDDTWTEIMKILDNRVEMSFNLKEFELPKMIKEYPNGSRTITNSVYLNLENNLTSFSPVWENAERINLEEIDDFLFDLDE